MLSDERIEQCPLWRCHLSDFTLKNFNIFFAFLRFFTANQFAYLKYLDKRFGIEQNAVRFYGMVRKRLLFNFITGTRNASS